MKEQFNDINFKNEVMEREYVGVNFDHCGFSEVMFGDVLFEDCKFKACNLSLCKSKATSWNNVSFVGCKMTGINFSEANRFTFRAGFSECQLQFASFHGLSLQGIRFDSCQLEGVDFSDCNLKRAIFSECELSQAEFIGCNLEYADFTTSRGFIINPSENRLTHAVFSRYGVEGLLAAYKIHIV